MLTMTTSAAFDRALAFVLHHEGGEKITDDPRDLGGLTKWGISKRAYPDLDIRALTRDDAAAIYRRDYWQAARCDDLPPAVAMMVFDTAVNQGVGTAAKFLQLAAGVTADGAIGPKTIAAVRQADVTTLLTEFAARRMSHYGRRSHFDVYGLGWARRLMACAALCLTFNRT